MAQGYDDIEWPTEGFSRVPFRLNRDPDVYAREQSDLFRGPVWNFVGLETEVPEPGDYKTNYIGDTPVAMVRNREGRVNVLVNRCAHRGNLVCYKNSGNAAKLTCVYHNWTYDLDGALKGVAFMRGVGGQGGMPSDFSMSDHSMPKLRTETLAGMVFATFSETTLPLKDYLGGEMLPNVERVMGRKMRVIGFYSQQMNNNWKLYVENNKDPYHASLLHLFHTTFRLNRLSMKGGIKLSDDAWHHISYSVASTDREAEEYSSDKIRAVSDDYSLEDPSIIRKWNEYPCGTTLAIQAIFPNLVIQQISNSIAVRLCLPKGPTTSEVQWWILSAESDTEEQRAMRVRQSNLVGPGGLISMEAGVVGGWITRATRNDGDVSEIIEMGGRDIAPSEDTRATEVPIRGFWKAYRECIEKRVGHG